MTRPDGWLGVKWGEDPAVAQKRLQVVCEEWSPWAGGQGYEVCSDPDRPRTVYGRLGFIRLVRRQGRVAGIEVVFRQAADDAEPLLTGLVEEFRLERGGPEAYHRFADGEVVRLHHDPVDKTCQITVTSAEFGRAYAEYLLRQGLGRLLRQP